MMMNLRTKAAVLRSLKRHGLPASRARAACAYAESRGATLYREALQLALEWAQTLRPATKAKG